MQSLEAAGVKQGQRVLIHAGAGGVGHFAVQLAKARGAHVITTAGPRNVDFVQQVGSQSSMSIPTGHTIALFMAMQQSQELFATPLTTEHASQQFHHPMPYNDSWLAFQRDVGYLCRSWAQMRP